MPHAEVDLGPVGTQTFDGPDSTGEVIITARGHLSVTSGLRATAGEVTHLNCTVTGGWDGGLLHQKGMLLPVRAARALFAALGQALDDMPDPWTDGPAPTEPEAQ